MPVRPEASLTNCQVVTNTFQILVTVIEHTCVLNQSVVTLKTLHPSLCSTSCVQTTSPAKKSERFHLEMHYIIIQRCLYLFFKLLFQTYNSNYQLFVCCQYYRMYCYALCKCSGGMELWTATQIEQERQK